MSDRDEVIDRLRAYRDRVRELLDLIGDKPVLIADETARTRVLYAALKARLRADVQAGTTVRGRVALTEPEKEHLEPAVARAATELTAATNTDPIRAGWRTQLDAACAALTGAIERLEAPA